MVICNKNGKELAKATKKITVIAEEHIDILKNNVNANKDRDIEITSNNLLLIPPNSGLSLPSNLVA